MLLVAISFLMLYCTHNSKSAYFQENFLIMNFFVYKTAINTLDYQAMDVFVMLNHVKANY